MKRANPASWITPESIAHARAGLPDLAFRRFVANQWTERAGHWLPPGAWQPCVTAPTIEDGETVSVGVDVGGQRSATAVAWVTDDLRVGVWIGHGDGAVLDAGDVIRELAAPASWSARSRSTRGAPASWPPSWSARASRWSPSRSRTARMIPASRAAARRGHGAPAPAARTSPSCTQHAANTIARHGRRGWRLDKPDDAHAERRDHRAVHGGRRGREPARAGPRARVRVKRRCIGCRRLLDAGLLLPSCQPRPADPGRVRGRRNQERRARLTAAQGGRCGQCGAIAPLELHHLDHDPANDDPANHVMLCRRCHRLAGGLSR